MISRRLLRIKALQILYAFFNKKDISLQTAEKELFHSIDKAEELFHYLLLLIIDIADYEDKIIQLRKNRITASDEDKNPNLRFTENRVIEQIRENEDFKSFLNYKKLSWVNHSDLIKKIHKQLIESEEFQEYMAIEENTYRNDKRIVKFLYSEILYNCEDLYANLEEQSIYWNDDIDFTINMIVKLIKAFKKNKISSVSIPKQYKQNDDKEFVRDLLIKTIFNHKKYEKIITEKIVNWDFERIAFIDKLILMLAISEIVEFSSIPVKVSFNEYIDIAKNYSSEKSGKFINGVLDKIIKHLEEEKLFEKRGRGLI